MNRTEFEHFILEHYDITPDYPWLKHPNFAVFRHSNNQKWFALVMDVQKSKLGLPGASYINVVNLKCDPILIGSLRSEPGFFPAYHMNKDGWVTVALDGSVPDEKIEMLLDMSYGMTAPKVRKQKTPKPPKSKGRKYPESFFKDLTAFAKSEILLPQAQSDAEYADYLISLIVASDFPYPSPAIRIMIKKVLIDYYKNNKTLTQISSEINRSFNRTCGLKKKGLALTIINLRTTGYPNSIDEYETEVSKQLREKQYKNEVMSGKILFPNSPVGLLDFRAPLLSNLYRNNIETVAQLMALTGNEHLSGIREKSWETIKAVQKEVAQRIQPEPLKDIEKYFRPGRIEIK